MTTKSGWNNDQTDINVNQKERWWHFASGIALMSMGLKSQGLARVGLTTVGGGLLYVAATGRSPVYKWVDKNSAIQTDSINVAVPQEQGQHVRKTVVINRSPEELFAYWRNFENLPKIMNHLESVTVQDDRHSHWKAKAPVGTTVEWDAEIVNEEPNKTIAWRSLPESEIPNAGSVRFKSLGYGRGTEVKVELEYTPPAGKLGAAVAKLLGEEPQVQIEEDLRRFKQLMETGEIATTEGQSSGREK